MAEERYCCVMRVQTAFFPMRCPRVDRHSIICTYIPDALNKKIYYIVFNVMSFMSPRSFSAIVFLRCLEGTCTVAVSS